MIYSEKAVREYHETQAKIEIEISRLQKQLVAHNIAAKNIDWAHVGNMQHILNTLKQLNKEVE